MRAVYPNVVYARTGIPSKSFYYLFAVMIRSISMSINGILYDNIFIKKGFIYTGFGGFLRYVDIIDVDRFKWLNW